MPQKKKTYSFFTIQDALNFHPDVRGFASKRPGVFRGKEEFFVLVNAACDPDCFSCRYGKPTVEAFGKIYSRQPDDVLAFMCVVRRILLKWERTQFGAVIKFFCKGVNAQLEDRTAERDASGKRVAVNVKSRLDGREHRIPLPDLTDEKLNGFFWPKIAHVSSLLDKELAALLKVNTASVKKARQELNRISYEIAYWNNPAVVNYQKTGIVTPELKRLTKNYSKGKK
jgi:hypothetical protein